VSLSPSQFERDPCGAFHQVFVGHRDSRFENQIELRETLAKGFVRWSVGLIRDAPIGDRRTSFRIGSARRRSFEESTSHGRLYRNPCAQISDWQTSALGKCAHWMDVITRSRGHKRGIPFGLMQQTTARPMRRFSYRSSTSGTKACLECSRSFRESGTCSPSRDSAIRSAGTVRRGPPMDWTCSRERSSWTCSRGRRSTETTWSNHNSRSRAEAAAQSRAAVG
jgi:hypothetical protein